MHTFSLYKIFTFILLFCDGAYKFKLRLCNFLVILRTGIYSTDLTSININGVVYTKFHIKFYSYLFDGDTDKSLNYPFLLKMKEEKNELNFCPSYFFLFV